MYTGVIRRTGHVVEAEALGSGRRLVVETDTGGVDPDDSVAVDGVCLAVKAVGDGRFEAFASPETLERTYLGDLAPGDRVNVERPLAAGERFHGHLLTGTVDTTTEVVAVEDDGPESGWTYRFEIPEGYRPFLIEKGPVALDGTSLTVAELGRSAFTVAVVPRTRERTVLSETGAGDPVHFEADVIGKYVARQTGDPAA